MNTQFPFKNILLVEDETTLAEILLLALSTRQTQVTWVQSLDQARSALMENPQSFELLLLDRSLPDGDGLVLCQELRARGFMGFILILTALGQVDQRVLGLKNGADDYLPKPFSWEELEARMEALARRRVTPVLGPEGKVPTSLWKVNEKELQIFGPKGWVILTPLEFKLVLEFLKAPGQIISRNQLLKKVWGFQLLPKTRTVDHFLGRLRKFFEHEPDQPTHFLTVRSAGYIFYPDPHTAKKKS